MVQYRPQGYEEQTCPIGMNLTQTLNNTVANKDFLAANARSASGLLYTNDNKVEKVFLIVLGTVENVYTDSNALDCTTATHNQWQIDLDNGGFVDLVNGSNADGQMLDNDWRCSVKGDNFPIVLEFDVTSQITNIDGKIGIRLANGRAEQTSLIVTISAFLKILWQV